jgi:hypothetical protein
MVVVAVGMLMGVQVSAARRRRPQKIEGLHGTARWITTAEELREIGFLPKSDADTGSGVYIGAWTDPKTRITHYLRHDGPEHIAPSPRPEAVRAWAWCCQHCSHTHIVAS